MSTRNGTNIARAVLAGSALVILSASLAEAVYGPRTKIGTNYQQTSTTTSNDGTTEGSCNGLFACRVLLQVTPGQKPLIVQHVSCFVDVSAGDLINAQLRARKGQLFPQKRTTLAPVNTTGTWWVVNSPAMHLIESGERSFISFSNSASATWSFVECNISGQLTQP